MSSPADSGKSSTIEPRTSEEARPQRTWNDFLPILSHAIRTPLNGILGMSKLLIQGQLPAGERRHAEIIQSSAESLVRLVDELHDLSKIEAGQLTLEPEDFALRELVRESVELLKPRAKAKRLDLRFTVAEGTPDFLIGDRRRLHQVLVNLIRNGIKFTRRGFVFVTVSREDGDETNDQRPWIRFSVRDTGIGVAPEMQSRIFEPFIQGASSDTGSYGGNGLGLSLSQGFIDLMNGEISLESIPGQGSTFTFAVPLEPGQEPAGQDRAPSSSTAESPVAPRRRQSCRILVAEDDEVNRVLALRVLADAGYEADAVHNGFNALEALEERSYELILMDCQMPELDGYEATRLIRQLEKGQSNTGYRHIPVIAVTALTMKGDREKCSDAGMDDFVAKPYRAEELIAAVDRHLGFGNGPGNASTSRVLNEKASSGVLDTEVFDQLRELTGPVQEGFLNTLVDTFVREKAERCQELELALEARENRRLAKLSHKLISASGSVGAYRMAKLAGDLEIRARENQLDECRSLLDDLVAEYDKVEAALRDVLASVR